MSIIEFEIKNPRKKLEFYEQLHKENITRIEKLRKEKKQLTEVIEEIKKVINNQMDYREFVDIVNAIEEILDKVGDSDE